MIKSKTELREYLEKDKYALGIKRRYPRLFGDSVWKFERILRKHEYYKNVGGVLEYWYRWQHYRWGLKLGFSIPCNVFGAGLRINHWGLIVVNPKAKIGEFCDIHQGVNIGENIDGCAPVIGDNVWIGPGCKIFGNINIADEIMIGANSVVNRNFNEPQRTIAGVPARIIKDTGNIYIKHFVKWKL